MEFGDPTTWIRVPSVVLGAATVPITYLLGVRTVGRSAGLFAAAVAAISPFAVFYGTEARAYATLMFLCVLSTLALLRGAGHRTGRALARPVRGSRRCSSCTRTIRVYSWWRPRRWWASGHPPRPLQGAAGGQPGHRPGVPAVGPVLPLPRRRAPPEQISLLSPVTLDSFVDAVLATFPGRPFVDLATVPGRAALVAIGAADRPRPGGDRLACSRGADPDRASASASSRVVLLALLAVATPLGITVYSLADTSLFAPRNLAASLPAAWLLLGALLTAARGVRGALIAGLAVAALSVGAVRSLDDDYRRPAYKEAAAWIDEHAAPCEPVVEAIWLAPGTPSARPSALSSGRAIRCTRIRAHEREGLASGGPLAGAACSWWCHRCRAFGACRGAPASAPASPCARGGPTEARYRWPCTNTPGQAGRTEPAPADDRGWARDDRAAPGRAAAGGAPRRSGLRGGRA